MSDTSKANLLSTIHNLRTTLDAEIARREKAEVRVKELEGPIPYRNAWTKPSATEGNFQRRYNYCHAEVIKWAWSGTFGQWGASVRFDDGYRCYTWPQPLRSKQE